MHRIDRFRRHLTRLSSGKRVIIILVAIGGIWLIFSYAVQSYNTSSKRVPNIDGTGNGEDSYFVGRKQTNAENDVPQLSFATESSTNSDTSLSLLNDDDANTFMAISKSGRDSVVISTTNGENGGNSDSEPGYNEETDILPFESMVDEQKGNDSLNNNTFKNNLFTFYCKNLRVRRTQKRNKNLIVYENFITPNHNMECHESITYTTHGDYRYLFDNLIPLVDRWNGPVSVAIYCPGSDLRKTLKIINFLRDCTFYKIRKFVTFHLFFDVVYSTPIAGESHWQWLDSMYKEETWENCSERPNLKKLRNETTFRMQKKLLYPVNVARNIARASSTTHFVLVSDIELYPSINLIPSFFKMLHDQHKVSGGNDRNVIIPARQVYVLPIFEVKHGIKPPKTKIELIPLLQSGDAIIFHSHICKECHLVPKFEEWNKMPSSQSSTNTLNVFHSAKRAPPYNFWEPIYIGSKYEPPYDERLSWEGLRDKMTQGYILCALDYNFLILDNGFLIHRPGIKRLIHKITKTVLRQDRLINFKIKVEFFRRFGKQGGCSL